MRPPVHVRTRVPSFSCQPLTSTGFTFAIRGGSCIAILTVGPSSASTESVKSETLPAGTCFGASSAWAPACATITSPSAATTTSEVLLISALPDWNGDGLRERLELASARFDQDLPVAGLREYAGRSRVVTRDDLLERNVDRAEAVAGKRRRQLRVVDVRRLAGRLEEVEVDGVRSGLRRLDRVVDLEVADGDEGVDDLRRRDRCLRRRLGDEDGRHSEDGGHDRELEPRGSQEPPLLEHRGDLPLEPRDGEAVVVGTEREQRQDEPDLEQQELAVGRVPEPVERLDLLI